MNYKIILASLLIITISHLPAVAYCQEGNPRSTNYIRRKSPNRCEGIIEEPINLSSLDLISIVTSSIASYGKTLSLQIPQIRGGKNPVVQVQSFGDNYRYKLDALSLSNKNSRYQFIWETYVLREAKIPSNSLRPLASYLLGSQKVYVPVILGQSSGKYEFSFYSGSRVKFPKFKIVKIDSSTKETTIYSTKQPNSKSGETVFTWDGRNTDGSNAPVGRYQVHYVAFIEQSNQPDERIERRINFEHNPSWLK
ncbi:FlgD immunoglobulin-like domain containing protein [Aulosira sp. FACHB-615]|uniref:FlgD immunoglobulin-like domain containing protein n=1 Tax=Nostocales TaxID=1161 RepID=UPI0016887E6F|nr:FlgD immunoglobulin-like domain containing protein [Aulosira sp. FACHB-615]MBD2486993.1 hypothetical protein [Aulosira sp. FACHB-615]